jgi:hypothetical protein
MTMSQNTIVNAILELAQLIEPSVAAVIIWYVHMPIRELGNLSARQLVEQGRANAVLAFLKSIYCGERG